MAIGRIKFETEIELGIDDAAQWFAGLTDDEQAKFFVAAVAHFKKGLDRPDALAESQWQAIGNHLATCECSTEEAREMIRSIMYGMEHSWTKPPVDLMAKAQYSNTSASDGTT